MSPLALALPWFLLGIPVLAGVLFLLHRLRIRHRRLEVVTTLFWQEAIEEARARVFVQRFRHPLVYAFLLLLSLLLWAGFADPRLSPDPEEQTLILVEGSARHVTEAGTAAALEAVQDLLTSMPRDGRTVLWCGAQQRTLLAPGEPVPLLAARWEGLEPASCPSTIAGIVARMGDLQSQAPEDTRLPLHMIVVGTSSLPEVLLAGLPTDVRVETLALPAFPGAEDAARSTRLVSLGLAPSRRGTWDDVDVLILLRTAPGSTPESPRLQVGGQPWSVPPAEIPLPGLDAPELSAEGIIRYLFEYLPAKGQLLEVFVGQQTEPLGSMVLPDRKILDVQLEAGLPDELRAVLEADPGLRLVDNDPDVRIGTRRAPEGTAQLWLDPKGDETVLRFVHAAGRRGEASLRKRFGSLGLANIDAAGSTAKGSADGSGVPETVRMEFVAGPARAIEMPLQLLGDGFNFVQSRAFPLFFAEAIRWLAGSQEAPRRVAAGELLAGTTGAWTDAQGDVLDPVGASIHLPHAGVYRGKDDAVLAASLQSPLDDSPTQALPELEAPSSAGTALLFWISLLALLGLVAEWFLVRTGRMP